MTNFTSRRSFLKSVGVGAAAVGTTASATAQQKKPIQGFEETLTEELVKDDRVEAVRTRMSSSSLARTRSPTCQLDSCRSTSRHVGSSWCCPHQPRSNSFPP